MDAGWGCWRRQVIADMDSSVATQRRYLHSLNTYNTEQKRLQVAVSVSYLRVPKLSAQRRLPVATLNDSLKHQRNKRMGEVNECG
jgi:hypothetical protein